MGVGAKIREGQASHASRSFCIVGAYGARGRKKDGELGSCAAYILREIGASLIITFDDCVVPRPTGNGGKGAKYIVSVDNNQASTKSFLDALELSVTGDSIEVVHLLGPGEKRDKVKAEMLQKKYNY